MSLEDDFPGLKDGHFKITSPRDINYNCMAWAMGDHSNWWEPSDAGFWPIGEKDFSSNGYANALTAMGFSECDSRDLENSIEKIAVFLEDGEVTHIARQLESGKWTSKLGSDVDIEHDLEGLEGSILGRVSYIYNSNSLSISAE